MSYRVTKADEAKPYEAAGHYNIHIKELFPPLDSHRDSMLHLDNHPY